MGLRDDFRRVLDALSEPVIPTDSTRDDRLDRTFQSNPTWVKPATDAAANTNTDWQYFFRAEAACKVTRVVLVPSGAVAADSTDYVTVTVGKGDGAAGTPDTITTIATSATAFAAGTTRTSTLSSTAANLLLDAGDTLCVKVVKSGAGKAMNVGDTVQVRLVEV